MKTVFIIFLVLIVGGFGLLFVFDFGGGHVEVDGNWFGFESNDVGEVADAGVFDGGGVDVVVAGVGDSDDVKGTAVGAGEIDWVEENADDVDEVLFVELAVPFIHETPDGVWVGSWKNACEEASVAMVEKFYEGVEEVDAETAKAVMRGLFAVEVSLWGSDRDADALWLERLISEGAGFEGRIVRAPDVDSIKAELVAGRPVISLHYGKILDNKNVPFLASVSYYHVLVVIGFDEDAQEFIVHDDGDEKTGAGHRYGYDLFMSSLGDFDFDSRTVDLGTPSVLFTSR